ncbi:delta-lactam-biosynthetic de-N-acetylase [Clostridium senegalense]|uniref:Delta-lactam-biosynthetic de-N-acetylase n=1 Tax=Clostridium senegalense TaxID=1465809 RepID=A0A6M0H637_9CLOT|nr:delta-lactam-biosynthetic de-N-acetylase [Clostridium senegalense]NEU06175.1 delta-lactam-biosynthetic de-N-acetylase [Clostridium senegalense]
MKKISKLLPLTLSVAVIGSCAFSYFSYCKQYLPENNEKYEMVMQTIKAEKDKNNKPPEKKEKKAEKMDTNVDNTCIDWWFVPNGNHEAPRLNDKLSFKFEDYDAHCLGDTSKKVLYLTFDEGYENGYTDKILDTLKENDVKAIFFVTLPYIRDNQDIIKRMVDEGHIVGNHSNHHPSMPEVATDESKFNKEFTDVEELFTETTGTEMPKFFRPPMGKYSQRSLAMTKNLGYKTVFWSFAYHDWDINNQPEPEKAKKKILDGLHNGSIMLIHAVSKTNNEILGDVIKEAKQQGYTFELLE